jgi:hypothetical protein
MLRYFWNIKKVGGMFDSYETHKNQNHVSAHKYYRQRNLKFSEALRYRKAIYLDTNFWIVLRDVERGLRTGPTEQEFLKALRKLVAEGKAFCPLSETSIIELSKQLGESSVLTGKLVDDLSCGVSLIPFDARISEEYEQFFRMHFRRSLGEAYGSGGVSVQDLIWTRVSVGFWSPGQEFDATLEKTLIDYLWGLSFSDLLIVGKDKIPSDAGHAKLAEILNKGSQQHVHELSSYAKAYETELKGGIDVIGNFIDKRINSIIQEVSGNRIGLGEEAVTLRNAWKNIVDHSFRNDSGAKDVLRTLHIFATLHAALRWRKVQKFKKNDFFDFTHALGALAYCDAFFTDRPLKSLLTDRHAMLDNLYGCFVTSVVDEALDYLRKLN